MSLRKITEADLQGYGVVGMEDTPNLSARAMQEKVEEVVRKVVIPAINENAENTASKQDLADAVFNAGAGDMKASYYDGNLDGIVNQADNGFFTYTHSKSGNIHYLYGNGSNVKFVSTAAFEDGDVFMIGENYYPAFLIDGDSLPGGFFKEDMVVSCFVHGNCLNFKQGGAGLNFKIVDGTTRPASPKENTIWVKTSQTVTSWDFSAQQPCKRSRNKNLVAYPFHNTTTTINGITFTDNKDGSIKASGTNTGTNSIFRIGATNITAENHNIVHLFTGTYTVSGCAAGGSQDSYFIEVYEDCYPDGDILIGRDIGEGLTFTLDHDAYIRLSVVIRPDVKANNLVFRPQLEKGRAATSFVKGDATGQVWIKTGTNGNVKFNALKKNGMFIYPQSCMQWDGSAWVSKDVKVYKNGQWLALKFWFLQGSNQYTGTTGGWTIVNSSNGAYQEPTIDSSGITFAATANIARNIGTVQPIDFTGIETLYISVPQISNKSGELHCVSFGINTSRSYSYNSSAAQGWTVEKFVNKPAAATNLVYALDTSGVNSGCYILLAVCCGTGNTLTVVVDEIYGV